MKKIKLEDINKENIFQTPPDYFEKLPLQIQQKLAEKPSKYTLIPTWKYALAACITLIVGVFVFRYVNNFDKQRESEVAKIIHNLPKQEMANYLDVEAAIDENDEILAIAAQTNKNFDDLVPLNTMTEEEIEEILLDELGIDHMPEDVLYN